MGTSYSWAFVLKMYAKVEKHNNNRTTPFPSQPFIQSTSEDKGVRSQIKAPNGTKLMP
jgi:hypothetical protein